jgi:predicted nucleic acid-binding protein
MDDLGRGPVALDTVVFIYLIEQHPRFSRAARQIFERIDAGKLQAVTSVLTLLEVLVVPYRAGRASLVERYEAFLTNSRGLRLVNPDLAQLKIAAQLRARFSMKTPDALQVAAALASRCSSFVTNDRRIPTIPGLRTLLLENYARK